MSPFGVQLALLGFYAVLAVWFGWMRLWPLSLYYAGCLVKDSAVYVLGLWISQ